MEIPQKLGDYLVRRRDPLPWAVSIVLAVAIWAYLWFTPMRWRGPYWVYWLAGLVGICIIAALTQWANRVRCPKCGADIKAIAPKTYADSYSGNCPQCGASFNERWGGG